MMSMKDSKLENTSYYMDIGMEEGEDVPFGPPPMEYNYRCSQCRHEMQVNEAIIDVEVGMAEFDGRYHEGYMPVLGCPACNGETMEYAKD